MTTEGAEKGPDRVKELVARAQELGKANAWDGAVEALGEALRIEPRDADTWALLGTAYRSCSSWDDAEAAYRTALGLAPGHLGATWGLGLLFGMKGDPLAAREWLGRAVSLEPRFAPSRFQLALTLLELGEAGGALAEHRVLEGLDPRYAARLAAVLREQGHLPA